MGKEKGRETETEVERKRGAGCGFVFLVEGGRAGMEREKAGERKGEKEGEAVCMWFCG